MKRRQIFGVLAVILAAGAYLSLGTPEDPAGVRPGAATASVPERPGETRPRSSPAKPSPSGRADLPPPETDDATPPEPPTAERAARYASNIAAVDAAIARARDEARDADYLAALQRRRDLLAAQAEAQGVDLGATGE